MKDDPSASSLNKGPSIVTASASCSVDIGSCLVARSLCFGLWSTLVCIGVCVCVCGKGGSTYCVGE